MLAVLVAIGLAAAVAAPAVVADRGDAPRPRPRPTVSPTPATSGSPTPRPPVSPPPATPPVAAPPEGAWGGLVARSLFDLSPGLSGRALVALTFDDGPSRAHTPAVLDILAAHGARATFFVIGRSAAADADLVRTTAARGHLVEGHSWDHVDLRRLSASAFADQVDRTTALIAELTGRTPACVRPPFGAYDDGVNARLRERGLANALWSLDTRDWQLPGTETIVRRAVDGLAPGAVILLHDGGGDRSQTVAALPRILDEIARRGFATAPLCG